MCLVPVITYCSPMRFPTTSDAKCRIIDLVGGSLFSVSSSTYCTSSASCCGLSNHEFAISVLLRGSLTALVSWSECTSIHAEAISNFFCRIFVLQILAIQLLTSHRQSEPWWLSYRVLNSRARLLFWWWGDR